MDMRIPPLRIKILLGSNLSTEIGRKAFAKRLPSRRKPGGEARPAMPAEPWVLAPHKAIGEFQ